MWTRFKAYATANRFSAALKIGGEADRPHKEDKDEARQEQKAKSETTKGIKLPCIIWLLLQQRP